jgi:hypothetical protein
LINITEAMKLIRGPASLSSRAEKFQLQTSGCSPDKPDGDVGITGGGAQLRRGSGPSQVPFSGPRATQSQDQAVIRRPCGFCTWVVKAEQGHCLPG